MVHFEIRNLTFSYAAAGDRHALDNINLTVARGEFLVFCGCSGSGKSTLLRQLKTALTPVGRRTGEIRFCGIPLEQVSQREQSGRIGFVMQNPADQIVTDKVWHELAFGLESLGCEESTMRARVAEMASYFGIQDWFRRDVQTLSGGQMQLLNLASAMVMQPEVLILDEPTSQMDPIAAGDFLNTVRKINTELGTTVLISEHRLEDILPYADRAVVMDGGKIVADDIPGRVGRLLYEQGSPMFAGMPTPVRVYYGTGGQGESPLTVRQGRSWLSREFPEEPRVRALPAPAPGQGRGAAVVLRELWFRYEREGADVLRGLSAEIPEGVLYAILGGNGAGKSTALRAIAGICRPYRGRVTLFGRRMEKYSSGQLFGGCLALLPQDPRGLFVKSTVRQELEEMSGDAGEIQRIVRLCRIAQLLDSHPYDLSGGEQQRVALAKVLLTGPRLLLLDEPTKGIDSGFKETLAQIIEQLKGQGVTVVMVSHDVEFCARHADLVSMLFDGQILTTNSPGSFFAANSFYTTAARRMSRHVFDGAVTAEDVIALYQKNRETDK